MKIAQCGRLSYMLCIKLPPFPLLTWDFTYLQQSWAQYCCEMWGGQFSVRLLKSSCRCKSKVFQIQISNLVYRGVSKARLITLIHQLGFIRAVSWSAQNTESHWSHVHITLIVENITFHIFYEVRLTARFEVFFKLLNVTKTINIFF